MSARGRYGVRKAEWNPSLISDLPEPAGNRVRHFILENRKVVPASSPMAWAEWFEAHYGARVVAYTAVGDVRVSTVFIGLDMNVLGPVNAPEVFETMIMGGKLDGETDRYSTWEGAERGHEAMVEQVRKTFRRRRS